MLTTAQLPAAKHIQEWGGGGAIYAEDASNVTHKGPALFADNSANNTAGGAVAMYGRFIGAECPALAAARSRFAASKFVTFQANAANTGGALYLSFAEALFAGGAQFVANAARDGTSAAAGGAVYSSTGTILKVRGAASFLNNTSSTGGAVQLASTAANCNWKPAATLEFTPGSSSCWMGNTAAQATAGAALQLDGSSIVNFTLPGQHNFGSNWAGAAGQQLESDIRVMRPQGVFYCGARARGVGRYSIAGNVCAVSCTGRSCPCPTGQVFSASKCSCQKQQ